MSFDKNSLSRQGKGPIMKSVAICIALLACSGLATATKPERKPEKAPTSSLGAAQDVDRRSYALGAIAAFSEMVDLGIKKLGFSTTFKPGEVDALLEEAQDIARRHNVKLYRESDLIVTDLFSADIAKDLEVLIIYSGNDIDDYLTLKDKKREYRRLGRYDAAARREVAYELGKLLSYPDAEIERLLSEEKMRERE